MKSCLEELVNDINNFAKCEVNFNIYLGKSVVVKPVTYTNYRINKYSNGSITFSTTGVRHYITDSDEIDKVDKFENGKKTIYNISKNGIKLLKICLY